MVVLLSFGEVMTTLGGDTDIIDPGAVAAPCEAADDTVLVTIVALDRL